MKFESAQKVAWAMKRINDLNRRIAWLDEVRQDSQNIPGMFGSEADEAFSVGACQKIRAIMKSDLASKLDAATKELTDLGVEIRERDHADAS